MPVMPLEEGDSPQGIGKGMASKGQVAPVQDFTGVVEALLQLEQGCKSMKSYQPPIFFEEVVPVKRGGDVDTDPIVIDPDL